ncbi:membrane-bound PQQ-dependent dehydrogenase, glucose/quinate/shikimate family [Aureimonas altamirensis]|uniref:membrane-bound PQQ-dependent dehydrogenase, glucose/quinate/shikimate family n=1 Tax=Aureimonas altamirensis TaxID=370622 RepID=UPI00301AE17A
MPEQTSSAFGRILLRFVGIVVIIAGLYLAGGGAWLAGLGGSWYYLLAGLVLLASGALIVSLSPTGTVLFCLVFLVTIPWALWEVGFDFWQLVARLFAIAVATCLLLFLHPTLQRAAGRQPSFAPYGAGLVLLVAIVATGVAAFSPKNVVEPTASYAAPDTPADPGEWREWGKDSFGTRFASIDQITPANVQDLQVAWTFRTGDLPESTGSGAEDQNTPIQVGDTVYVCSAYGKVFAIDADAGTERWRFDPQAQSPNWQRCRGLAYWEAGNGPAPAADTAPPAGGEGQPAPQAADAALCRGRLFLPTIDARLIALDAETGQPCADFGQNGTVDLTVGMGEVQPGYYQQTSTALVAGDLVIVGGRVADNFSTDEPPGVVRAFDVRTGNLAWAWDPGNPDLTGEPPAGETYTRGTPNVWAAMSYDPELGLVYLPTGNATPDFWTGHRSELDNRYSSSVVALDQATGQVRWTFQGVRRDIWDFDMPAQPVLYDIPDGNGGTVPALAQVTKQGMIFLLNRETGEPIAEVEDRPVPQGNLEGETYSPTQPFSVGMPMIGNETLTEADMWGATPFDQLLCRIAFRDMRVEGIFTPPGLDKALQFPGSLGGMNWGAVSIDATTNLMYVNDMRLGLANYMVPRADIPAGASGIEMGVVPQEGTPFGAMRMRFLSPLGIPCQKPPFGTLSAIDLKTHELVWQVPLGTVEDTGPLGFAMGLPIPIGMPTLGPSLATHSGLVFFAGTQDFYLRAFDGRTGKELWKGRLPVGSQGGPMSYVSPASGKQYVVVTAGGARQSPERGDYVIAYTLP